SHPPALRPVRAPARTALGRVARSSFVAEPPEPPPDGDRDYHRRLCLAPPVARVPRPRPLRHRQQAPGLAAGGAGQAHPGAAARLPGGRHPRAGKTTFALTLASWLLHHHVVQQITVVAPTEHLKKQWADAAARIGIKLDPEYSAGPLGKEYHGVAVTYAGVGVRPMLHRNRVEQ